MCRHLPPDTVLARVPKADFMAWATARYAQAQQLTYQPIETGRVVACPDRTRQIAKAYLAGARFDEDALPAYRAFRRETKAQFDFLTSSRKRGGLGIHVELSILDPYPDAAAMTHDLAVNARLRVYRTGGRGNSHPLLTPDENDMFRAVHDAFGHAASCRGFDRHGEEAAWAKHSQAYSSLARLAMTTETRGQTSVFVWRYQGRQFPEQKVLLLPARLCDPSTLCLAPGRAGPPGPGGCPPARMT